MKHTWLKLVLVLFYLTLIAQCIDAVHAGTKADEQRLDGGTTGWFGRAWLAMIVLNFIVIVALHVILATSRHNNSDTNSTIS